MGYACPVCETPQRDGEHLANHLAFTAMLRGDAHEAWLEERVEGWDGHTPAELAAAVTPHAEETTYEEVFEDTADHDQGHEHGHGRGHGHDDGYGYDPGRPDVAAGGSVAGRGNGAGDALGGLGREVTDAAVESVLEEARELTDAMYETESDDGEDSSESDGRADANARDGDEPGTDPAGTDDTDDR